MAFTTQQGRTSTSLSEINVTPLVDVMLVLLVIFMVTAPMLQTGIDIRLPKTRAATDSNPSDNVVLSISHDGILYYGSDPISLYEVSARLKKEARQPDAPIFVRADEDVKVGSLISVMDTVRSAGYAELKFVTQPFESPSRK